MTDSRAGAGLMWAVVIVAAVLAGCRPTGDFGRAKPSVIHDTVLPKIGNLAATLREEPTSGFNYTDDEGELRDRAWGFIRAPHVRDWWVDLLTEGQRTRVLPMLDDGFQGDAAWAIDNPWFTIMPALAAPSDHTRYYAFLRTDRFASSEPRWSRVMADIQADTALVPPFCAVATRVRRIDDERLAVLNRQRDQDPVLIADARIRVDENDAVVGWVWKALDYRLNSYRFAIDRLEVETPSSKLWAANRALAALAAQRCDGAPGRAPGEASAVRRPSRLMTPRAPEEGPVLQK